MRSPFMPPRRLGTSSPAKSLWPLAIGLLVFAALAWYVVGSNDEPAPTASTPSAATSLADLKLESETVRRAIDRADYGLARAAAVRISQKVDRMMAEEAK